jgi:hypothetical protein
MSFCVGSGRERGRQEEVGTKNTELPSRVRAKVAEKIEVDGRGAGGGEEVFLDEVSARALSPERRVREAQGGARRRGGGTGESAEE